MWKAIRPDTSSIWDHHEVKRILSRYKSILNKKKPAKYLIFKKIPIDIDLENSSDEFLWKTHNKIKEQVINGEYLKEFSNKKNITHDNFSYLDLKIELLKRIIENCHLCERNCGVNRLRNDKGYCKVPKFGKIYSAHLHFGEESPLVPSGTIFFTGCTFSCCFCQNFDISTNPDSGHPINPKKLAAYANSLARDEGAKNINYVTPLPHTYVIVKSMKFQRINVAQLWNSNHYCSEDCMHIISDLFDIWLPDFKYGNDQCALELSNAPNYWKTITRNHKIIYDAKGEIIIRHLVMPGHIECCTKPILKWIAENIPKVLVNVMGQYRPAHLVLKNQEKYRKIARRPSKNELD
ncbi:MAG: pyruvate formate lyase-activating protein, partial [Promethearchaeota archaeon]